MAEAYVLVVDDDKLILDLVTMRLEGAGFRVTTAMDAWQAVVQAGGLKIGLVITDIQMPGVGNGVDGYRKLRAASPQMPVIFMSGMRPDDVAKVLPTGDPKMRFVPKPINFEDLQKAIKEMTGVDRKL
ncbi:MAG: response regulator [Elusimicrobia bacterium]|nr:response regulator [Elusimicrobiota bacterium]